MINNVADFTLKWVFL